MKKLFWLFVFLPSLSWASVIVNPTRLSSTTLPAGSTQYIQNSGTSTRPAYTVSSATVLSSVTFQNVAQTIWTSVSSVTINDTILWDFSPINDSTTTEGIRLPQNTDCSTATAQGQVCWNTGNKGFYIGDGSIAKRTNGAVYDHFTTTGNVGTAETDLYRETIDSTIFYSTGDCLEGRYGGSVAGAGTSSRDIRFYVTTTTVFDTGGFAISTAGDWRLEITICRDAATTVRSIAAFNTGGASTSVYTQFSQVGGLTFTGSNTFKLTGQSTGVGAASSDVVAKLGKGGRLPRAD